MRKITAGKLNEDKEPLFREDTTAHILRFALPLLLPGSTFFAAPVRLQRIPSAVIFTVKRAMETQCTFVQLEKTTLW